VRHSKSPLDCCSSTGVLLVTSCPCSH
jgi:hypothetical protein